MRRWLAIVVSVVSACAGDVGYRETVMHVGTEPCGNGFVDLGESCDTAIVDGPGTCPVVADCADGQACTTDEVIGTGCQQQCFNEPITEPDDGADGCCPEDAGNDPDCTVEDCGNGLIDEGETCDPAITSGPGTCPTVSDCQDADTCTSDSVDNAGTCQAACSHGDRGPADGDECCPDGANNNTDADCVPVCGNNVIESGEDCESPSTAVCDASCQTIESPAAMRLDTLHLRDPHVFLKLDNKCADVTDSANVSLDRQLSSDNDPKDGNLDLSPVLYFDPLDQKAGSTTKVSWDPGAVCTVSGGCSSSTSTYDTSATSREGQCVGTLPNTTNSSYGSINEPTNQCFATKARDLVIELQGASITLRDATIGAQYDGDPASGLTTGLLRGFITEEDAKQTVIEIPSVGPKRLSKLLAGGDSCASHSDADTHDGVRGWWFYFNFTAVRARYKP